MTLDPLAVVRRRLRQQRMVGEPFAGPEQAVAWSGAVQGQEFAEVKWSLAQRTGGRTDAEIEEVLDRGDVLRTHLLRPTWHLVARADVRWLLRLTRPRVHALNRYWYRKFELDAALLARGHRILAAAVAEDGPRTRTELARRLAAEGIEADGLRLGYLLMHAELEEVLCSGPRRGKQQTYALLDHRAPTAPGDDRPHDEAVAELTLRYFRSHGPATLRDFSTWSSLTVADARAALDRIGDGLERAEHDGTTWYAEPSTAAAVEYATTALLVPMYDETIVAHQDLRVVLAHPSARAELLERAVVVDGLTVGTWKRTLGRRSATVDVTLFGPIGPAESAALDDAVRRFGRFLAVPAELVVHRLPEG
ncbi:winged helix DNA-binding domain-containing protein [Pseudonocardia lacus]|uniref:winged helix DNA-binding domain-containing protein n=1 Tax=Pseudonocardia lacus TaxID=2835865 RepID=UPI001BDC30E7|nr:winged helix DNA-binding domain-containing protein [Pseudonocardia lacus]